MNDDDHFSGKAQKSMRDIKNIKKHSKKTEGKNSIQNIKFSTELKQVPPWLKFPNYERSCIGWRMGGGEDYWHSFWKEYCNLDSKQQKWYRQDFPEPTSWTGIYNDMSDYNTDD
jgi:hypothetical protein